MRGLLAQGIVEEFRFFDIPLQKAEHQTEIIVESVGRHAGALPVTLLAHLEGRTQVLRVPDHGNRNVSNEHGSFQRFVFVKIHQRGAQGVRNTPSVYEQDAAFAVKTHA